MSSHRSPAMARAMPIANGADCGFALALMATHAIETIEAARAALADTGD